MWLYVSMLYRNGLWDIQQVSKRVHLEEVKVLGHIVAQQVNQLVATLCFRQAHIVAWVLDLQCLLAALLCTALHWPLTFSSASRNCLRFRLSGVRLEALSGGKDCATSKRCSSSNM